MSRECQFSRYSKSFVLLNGSDLRESDPGRFIVSDNTLVFVITRDIEGVYSCGNESARPLSNNRSLIGE